MGRMMAAPDLQVLTSRLNLTAEQQGKIKVMIAKFDGDTKGARATLTKNREAIQGGADPASFREENMGAMMVVRDATTELHGGIRGALTPEQQAEFDKWLEEQRASMRQGRPGGPPPAF
jgi:Spy/CpxP family protein refolding chaperone